jgi:hypothetical protein
VVSSLQAKDNGDYKDQQIKTRILPESSSAVSSVVSGSRVVLRDQYYHSKGAFGLVEMPQ